MFKFDDDDEEEEEKEKIIGKNNDILETISDWIKSKGNLKMNMC